ncbi:uncharacterized protein LOC143468815 isoform X3 [Clavelina lepadiformis]|uniref:Major facilitator superfamily (MFS) profile domain-containing protein n=1 Tax=Clavelina lepadiformis TaxID=159417 RepID=A0ABP0F7D8_CLALP
MALTFRGESWYSWYSVIIMMGCYAFGELGHFLIGIVSRPLAQDVKFGDQGCLPNRTDTNKDHIKDCFGSNYTSCSEMTINSTTYCEWNYLGSGIEYQVLAGPAFIAVFTVMGIILGVIGDLYNRVRLLSLCVTVYSLMAILTGFSSQYWQLILLRFGFGAGEAGCSPLTASIVADKFSLRSRGLAMSLFNWGIYFGYGLAFTVGNYVTQANIIGQGWRWSYFLTGLPGLIMMALLITTVKEPQRTDVVAKKASAEEGVLSENHPETDDHLLAESTNQVKQEKPNGFATFCKALKLFVSNPAILMLLLAASVRHTASFCWAYNTQIYFNLYYPEVDLGSWMLLCSIVGGSIGIASGGIISDLVVSKYGINTRLWVLVISQAVASPLAAMVLYLSPPYCFITLLSAYLFAEMWFGILFTVFVEIFPIHVRSTSIAIFIFVMNNIASSGQLLVPTLRYYLGLRTALYFTYAGFYGLSSVCFLCTQLIIRKQQQGRENLAVNHKERNEI